MTGNKNLAKMKEFITRENIHQVMAIQFNDQTLLHHFIDSNWHEGILYLLAIGADAETLSKTGYTPLMRAVSDGGSSEADVETVNILLAHKCDVEATMVINKKIFTPLQFAANANKKKIGKSLISKGANPNRVWGHARRRKWLGIYK